MEAGSWNWLEVARLSAGLLTPVAVGFLGVYLNRVSKRFEMRQWQSQKLTEKRLAIYDELAPTFNDLLCFFTYVGSWRDINPPVVVSWKRVIDKKVNLASPLFSPNSMQPVTRSSPLATRRSTRGDKTQNSRRSFPGGKNTARSGTQNGRIASPPTTQSIHEPSKMLTGT
ncbi:MAG TPA: hypothetical protein VG387_03340 [Rhizomicrobium sp.]|jgi:hypothetical protein|nr:hypothetical protein [Rhizomicrobium sp.]